MQIKTSFPREVREIRHTWIPMRDGARLAARIWLPEDAELSPVPALLEYIPYRKNDATAERDAAIHPYFAGHGYASVRVDMRGSGDSDGILHDEYLPLEQEDGVEVIAWLAGQPWCTGAVGMFGKSWGGFNALQVAALRPPALKAIVTVVLDRRPLRRRRPLHRRLRARRGHALLGLDDARATTRGHPTRPSSASAGASSGSSGWSGRRPSSRPGSRTSAATSSGSRARCARTTPRSSAPSTWSAAGPTPTGTRSSASLRASPARARA